MRRFSQYTTQWKKDSINKIAMNCNRTIDATSYYTPGYEVSAPRACILPTHLRLSLAALPYRDLRFEVTQTFSSCRTTVPSRSFPLRVLRHVIPFSYLTMIKQAVPAPRSPAQRSRCLRFLPSLFQRHVSQHTRSRPICSGEQPGGSSLR